MATKDTVPGLLSKVAKFVRNPTKDWSDLDHLDSTPESGYDKQALKEMIERKRQNDFVRKREFDQLRKLRTRDGVGLGALARASAFQSSVTTDQDGRAVTLKKIDEIEAQMSKQWWKGKQEPAAADAPAAPTPGAAAHARDEHPATVSGAQSTLPSTENSRRLMSTRSGGGFSASEQVDTEVGFGMPRAPVPRGGDRRSADRASAAAPFFPRADATDVGFSTSKLFAIEVDEMATDPELEEAAIRFANGDDEGAEASLLQALRADALMPDVALSWAAALLDFYRATQQRSKFDQAVVEFAMRFGNTTPQWSRAPAAHAAHDAHHLVDTLPQGVGAHAAEPTIWESPAELSVLAMEQLREAMASHPMPWHLGWAQLQHISADAMPLLGGLFSSLCDEPVELRFSGSEVLVQLLRKLMPAGGRDIDPAWWAVRLNALRAMALPDDFELAALDYCVTYEVSPPAWTPARCHFVNTSAAVARSPGFAATELSAMPGDTGQAATAPMALDAMPGALGHTLELGGDVLGDATKLLAAAGGPLHGGERIIVSCANLVRVDFSAAGSILNWVAVRQSEGCQVQFRDVHRLVAAFFNVIGINEHARVVPKPI